MSVALRWTWSCANCKELGRSNRAPLQSTAVAEFYYNIASKKRKDCDERTVLRTDWARKYFFTETDRKPVCPIRRRTDSVTKQYSITRRYM